ncbi:MAG: hypothetical protein NXY57DRAFT_373304 [Lentinula lateritia]|nr:MAG: hypothetical protein NXY57DRAFT_373304 [Lentinula lateritia]
MGIEMNRFFWSIFWNYSPPLFRVSCLHLSSFASEETSSLSTFTTTIPRAAPPNPSTTITKSLTPTTTTLQNRSRSTCKWRFQHVPSSDSWQLVFSRDLIDTAMLRFAGRMVWFPISYTLLLLPSGIAGLSAARGHPVSHGAEVGVTYNSIGGCRCPLVSVSLWVEIKHSNLVCNPWILWV